MVSSVIMAAGSMLQLLPKLLVACPKVDESKFQTVFGPSSSLRDKIENGQRCDLFISAHSTHTDALVKAEIFGRGAVFGLNPTVLVYRSDNDVADTGILQLLADPSWQLGMSTSGLNPSDTEFEILSKISEAIESDPEALASRTRLITGGRENPNAPNGRNQIGWVMETQEIDLLLTFQSNAIDAVADNPGLQFTELPLSIRVVGQYGIGVSIDACREVKELYDWLLSTEGKNVLEQNGLERP